MKFMFMIYHDEKTLDALPDGEMQALVDSALDYTDEIRRSGHYIVSNALQRARDRPDRSGSAAARSRPPTAPSPRPRSSSAASTSSRPRT